MKIKNIKPRRRNSPIESISMLDEQPVRVSVATFTIIGTAAQAVELEYLDLDQV